MAAVRIDVVGAVLHVVLGDDDQRVGRVAAFATACDQPADRQVASACCVSGVFTPPSAVPKLPMWSWLKRTSDRLGQIALGDELIELALPFVVAPQIRIVLVVAAEVDVGQRGERRIERRDLNDRRPRTDR